jgi:hypothetical protein
MEKRGGTCESSFIASFPAASFAHGNFGATALRDDIKPEQKKSHSKGRYQHEARRK